MIPEARPTEKQNCIEYNGFWKPANSKPEGEYILVWVSDWLKKDSGFYYYIALDTYRQDLEAIHALIGELNFRGSIAISSRLIQLIHIEEHNYAAHH